MPFLEHVFFHFSLVFEGEVSKIASVPGMNGIVIILQHGEYRTVYANLRKSLVKMLKDRCKEMPANAIHKNAIIPESVHLGFGNFINAGVIIGSGSKLGNHCILHTGSIIDQDCQVSDYVQIGAAAVINQNVIIEDEVFIGSGAIIVSEIKIGKGARIGAGSIVIENIKPGATVFGNPAKSID